MDKRYDFDLIIPEEEFKKNQKREMYRQQEIATRIKKENRIILIIGLIMTVITISVMFLSINSFKNDAQNCDTQKGYTCSYYEIIKNNG